MVIYVPTRGIFVTFVMHDAPDSLLPALKQQNSKTFKRKDITKSVIYVDDSVFQINQKVWTNRLYNFTPNVDLSEGNIFTEVLVGLSV